MLCSFLDLALGDEFRIALEFVQIYRFIVHLVVGGQLSAVHDLHELFQLLLVASDKCQLGLSALHY